MRLRISNTLRFWVDCECDQRTDDRDDCSTSELLTEILREFEEAGDAMRYLDRKSRVAWKATPRMLTRLVDAEREVEDDWADLL